MEASTVLEGHGPTSPIVEEPVESSHGGYAKNIIDIRRDQPLQAKVSKL